MSLTVLDENIWFPPIETALEDGLLAMGGDLRTERLIKAYQEGIFPWYEGETPLWWSPNPRFVLYPAQLKVSATMKQVIKRKEFVFKTNTAFDQVIANCKKIKREGQAGTWITNEVEKHTMFYTLYVLLIAPRHGKATNLWVDSMALKWANYFLEKVCLAPKAMPASLLLLVMYNS